MWGERWAGAWRHDLKRTAGTHGGAKRLELEEVRVPEAPDIGVYLCLCDMCVCLCGLCENMWRVYVCVWTMWYIWKHMCRGWFCVWCVDTWDEHRCVALCLYLFVHLYKVDSFFTYEV